MDRSLMKWTALGTIAGALVACVPPRQPPVSGPSGANPQAQGVFGSGASPGVGAGGAVPSVNVTGGGLGGAQFTHPGAAGTGHAH